MEACIREDLPPTTELEEGLRNGVYLAKLANFFAPDKVPIKRIYDRDQTRFKVNGISELFCDHEDHKAHLTSWCFENACDSSARISCVTLLGAKFVVYPDTCLTIFLAFFLSVPFNHSCPNVHVLLGFHEFAVLHSK